MKQHLILLIVVLSVSPMLWRAGVAKGYVRTRQLPEVIVKSRRKNANIMHIAGVVREYSYMQTHFDTVFLFRDKLVDFMIPLPVEKKYTGWKVARTLKCDSYLMFFDYNGKDSVSNTYFINFSLGNRIALPREVRLQDYAVDSVRISVNLLDVGNPEVWHPGADSFLKTNTNIDRFDVAYYFDNVDGMNPLLPVYLSKVLYTLESFGPINSIRLPGLASRSFQVNTLCELYITDRSFITVKEAKKYWKHPLLVVEECDFTSVGIPPLRPEIEELVARVNSIDHLKLRLNEVTDSLRKGFYYTHPPRIINFHNWLRGMVGLPALPRK